MTLQERITDLVSADKKKNASALARFAKITRTAVSDWKSGKSKSIKAEHALKVAQFYGVNAELVITGKGPKYPTGAAKQPPKDLNILGPVELPGEGMEEGEEVFLNFIEETGSPDNPRKRQVKTNFQAKLRFSKWKLQRQGIAIEHAVCAEVCGNCMEPVLFEGCTVGIDTANTEIKNGDLYAIDHDGRLRIKLVYKIPMGGLRLRNYNLDEYPDEIYSADEAKSIKIIGRVFWYTVLR